jgi:hypothetical protein
MKNFIAFLSMDKKREGEVQHLERQGEGQSEA